MALEKPFVGTYQAPKGLGTLRSVGVAHNYGKLAINKLANYSAGTPVHPISSRPIEPRCKSKIQITGTHAGNRYLSRYCQLPLFPHASHSCHGTLACMPRKNHKKCPRNCKDLINTFTSSTEIEPGTWNRPSPSQLTTKDFNYK